MSSRRFAGVLVLILAIVGSLLVARIDGVRVAGSAIPVPGSGVPRVGDCVGEVRDSLVVPFRGAFPPPTLSVANVGELSVTFTPCAGQHIGEVVAFRLTPRPVSGTAAGESDSEWCREVAAGYQAHSIWRFRAAGGDHWVPSTNQRFVAILSASTERSWGACAVLAPGLELYSGSFVESMADRPAPAPFGLCRSGDNPDRWVSCVSPHGVQEFGVAAAAGMSSRKAVDDCRELISAMTGMQDVTADGLLRLQVVGGGGNFGDPSLDDTSALGRCRLTAVGSVQLNGTLIGIGAGKLPLA